MVLFQVRVVDLLYFGGCGFHAFSWDDRALICRFNGLGDCGATAMAEGLRHTTKLRELSLW